MYQFTYQPTPKNILLDLMGVNKNGELATSQLNLISQAFDISINNLRVCLNRLVSADLITNDDRGVYCLTEKALAKRAFINRWRHDTFAYAGWNYSWMACHLPKGGDRNLRKKSLVALQWYGFTLGLDQLWIRPNNLMVNCSELSMELTQLGLENHAHCFVLQEVPDALASQWAHNLWNITQLDAEYSALVQSLKTSLENLEKKSLDASLAETCRLGGEAIHRLAIDPLLPKEIRPQKKYQQLKTTMLKYDRVGRNIWLNQLEQLGVHP
jgi:phenylacetic acid degradation operon negative regulatory protein